MVRPKAAAFTSELRRAVIIGRSPNILLPGMLPSRELQLPLRTLLHRVRDDAQRENSRTLIRMSTKQWLVSRLSKPTARGVGVFGYNKGKESSRSRYAIVA